MSSKRNFHGDDGEGGSASTTPTTNFSTTPADARRARPTPSPIAVPLTGLFGTLDEDSDDSDQTVADLARSVKQVTFLKILEALLTQYLHNKNTVS
jgi:hypothetical protein